MSIIERTIKNSALGVDLKIFIKNNNPYFIGVEIARKLEFRNKRKAIRDHVKDKHKIRFGEFCKDLSSARKSEMFSQLNPMSFIISEPAFYKLCIRSNSPEMEPFQEWVCEMLVDIRKGNNPNLEGLSLIDNPIDIIREVLIPQIPDYSEGGNNSLRKEMCRLFKDAYNLSKNPYNVRAGKKGGRETQKRIREIKDSFENLKKKIEKQIKKVESDIEETLRQISTSESERSSSEDEY